MEQQPTFPLEWRRRTTPLPLLFATTVCGIALFPEAGFAQAAPEDFLGIYESASDALKSDALAIARALFLSLAVLEAIVTAYGMTVDEQVGIDSIFRRLAMKAVVLGAIFLLLLRPEIAIDRVFRGLESVGAEIAGHAVMGPGEILVRGFMFSTELNSLYDFQLEGSGFGLTYVGAVIAALAAQIPVLLMLYMAMIFSWIAFGLLAGQLIVVKIKLFFALTVGLFFAGFASFRATAGMPEAWLRYGTQLGVQLFMIQVMLGLAERMFDAWEGMMAQAFYVGYMPDAENPLLKLTFFEPGPVFSLLLSIALYTYLAVKIPAEISGRVTSDLRFGLSESVRG